jgi:hypothetical protein
MQWLMPVYYVTKDSQNVRVTLTKRAQTGSCYDTVSGRVHNDNLSSH